MMDERKHLTLNIILFLEVELGNRLLKGAYRFEGNEKIHKLPRIVKGRQPPVYLEVMLSKKDLPLLIISTERCSEEMAEFEVIGQPDLNRQTSSEQMGDLTNRVLRACLPAEPLVVAGLLGEEDLSFKVTENAHPELGKMKKRRYKNPKDNNIEIVVYTTVRPMEEILKDYILERLNAESVKAMSLPSLEETKLLANIFNPSERDRRIERAEFGKEELLETSLLAQMPIRIREMENALRSRLLERKPVWGVLEEIDSHFTQQGGNSALELSEALQGFLGEWEIEHSKPLAFSSYISTEESKGWEVESPLGLEEALQYNN